MGFIPVGCSGHNMLNSSSFLFDDGALNLPSPSKLNYHHKVCYIFNDKVCLSFCSHKSKWPLWKR